MSPSLLAGASHLPVTAIEFLTQTTVLVGAGNQLSLYDITNRCLVHRIRVFKKTPARIYGIIVRPIGDDEMQKVLVFGAKQWAVINVCKGIIAVVYQYRMVDWIKAAHWCWCPQRSRWMAVVASAHNRVFLCDPDEAGKVIATAQCEERCILYSAAFHGRLLETLVVASGTVFNQVLVWRPQWSENDSLVDKRLAAHDGVVFHVRFSSDGSELVSASDDRTLRIWDVQGGGAKETLYGHRARVWTGAALQGCVVSASEDGSCRVWSRGQKDEHAILWQSKKNVWTLAIGPLEDLMVAGAADGSVFVWSLNDTVVGSRLKSTEMLKASDLPLPAEYYPAIRSRSEHIRCFFLVCSQSVDIDEPTVIAVMDSGCVLRKQPDSEWDLLCHVPGLVGYSVLGCSLSGDLAAVGMRDGSVILLGGSVADPWPTLQLHTARVDLVRVMEDTSKKEKVFDLITVDCGCRIVWSRVSVDAVFGWRPVAELRLPGRARMASAAVNLALGWAVVGSHNGGLYFFDLPQEDLSGSSESEPLVLLPAVSWSLAHTDAAITSIVLQASASSSRCATVVTAGKDGFMQCFEVSLDARNGQTTSTTACGLHTRVGPAATSQAKSASVVCVRRTASERLTFGSVGGLYVIDQRLYAVTFYRNRLVLVDACSHTDVFSVAFAERDRRWQMHYRDGLYLGFINKMQALACPVSLRSHRESYALVQGVSSLDIRAVSSTSINSRSTIIALGGEDCVLRVCEITGRGTVECLAQALKHSSVIRCVLFVPGAGGSRYILTAGGSCELRCWTLFGLDQSASLLEWAVAPSVFSNDCDSRIMDLAIVSETCGSVLVAAAYSDASIRLWRLCLVTSKFVCVAHDSSRAHGRCILALSVATVVDTSEKASTALFSGATDGRVFIWDLTGFVHKEQCATDSDHGILEPLEPLELGPPIAVIDGVHQSGVNTLDTVVLPNKQIAVATGGDDNSICFFTVSCSVLLGCAGSVGDCGICRYENAHASAVQQVRFAGTHMLCSVATDQRVATWSVDHGSITMLSMECTQVADPSAMVLLDPNREDSRLELVVAGIGIEAFEIKPE
ncbi:WD repeat-containing protein 6 [Coemansia sp. RSA 486]|nr:WD repeat-containing protein 6 [Coemansia sp. RSA 486]KAJ2237476.1 WD repeat-containing protein 6 [Coemansia sp. RSA 485]